MTWAEAFVTSIAAVASAALGGYARATVASRLRAGEARRASALMLLDRYTSPDFAIVRGETMNAMRAWKAGEHGIIDTFVHPGEVGANEPVCANGLTRRQNLSRMLYFWATVATYHEQNLVDKQIIRNLLSHFYWWWRDFFTEFAEEYVTLRATPHHASDASDMPPWLGAIEYLNRHF